MQTAELVPVLFKVLFALIACLIADDRRTISKKGTDGESGHGMGLSIVKSFMDFFGGELAIVSRPRDAYPEDHGTVVKLRFDAPTSRK